MQINLVNPVKQSIRFGQDPVNRGLGLNVSGHDPVQEAMKAADLLKHLSADHPEQLSRIELLTGLSIKKTAIIATKSTGVIGDIWTSIEPISGIIFTALAAAAAATSIYFFGNKQAAEINTTV